MSKSDQSLTSNQSEDARPSDQSADRRSIDEQCKGFWNMCACERCREADRKLAAASPDERKVASEQAKAHLDERAKSGASK